MDHARYHLLNDFQRNFPLVDRPFAAIAQALGESESWALQNLKAALANGEISRVGPVFRPNCIGVSTLVALAVPPERLAATAELISQRPEVNHNYEREHRYNLWFVATAPHRKHLDALLADIRRQTGCPLLDLPLQQSFHIDLGFNLADGRRQQLQQKRLPGQAVSLSHGQYALIAALQDGLPLCADPYHVLAERLNCAAMEIQQQLADWLQDDVISRFGVVVRHHEFGFAANAMVVWDVPEERLLQVGRQLAAADGVNLCYSRPRRLPEWRYNLFCMLHGRDRGEVEARLAQLAAEPLLAGLQHSPLFSRRRFKQRGARYVLS